MDHCLVDEPLWVSIFARRKRVAGSFWTHGPDILYQGPIKDAGLFLNVFNGRVSFNWAQIKGETGLEWQFTLSAPFEKSPETKDVRDRLAALEAQIAKLITTPANKPVCWMWTLLVDDEYLPGSSGGRKTMQIPSLCSDNDAITREVEGRWKTKVIEIKKRAALYEHQG
jgi:hypothetical protein